MDHLSLSRLSLILMPTLAVVWILWRWQLSYQTALYALARMLVQLLLIGYVLTFLFHTENAALIVLVLSIMLLTASWIALRTIDLPRHLLYRHAFSAILLGGGSILYIVTQWVLQIEPWYQPAKMIPLAGMIFANAMNSLSIAGERLQAELGHGQSYEAARSAAYQAALIQMTNALFAVGLVSLPGMMTGQILAGVDPAIAVRYQIMVMCMIFAAVGLSSALFLILIRPYYESGTD